MQEEAEDPRGGRRSNWSSDISKVFLDMSERVDIQACFDERQRCQNLPAYSVLSLSLRKSEKPASNQINQTTTVKEVETYSVLSVEMAEFTKVRETRLKSNKSDHNSKRSRNVQAYSVLRWLSLPKSEKPASNQINQTTTVKEAETNKRTQC